MGACCSGKGGNSKLDKQLYRTSLNQNNNQIMTTSILNNSNSTFKKLLSATSFTGTPFFKLYFEETEVAQNMNCLIKKFIFDEKNCLIKNSNLKIRKLNIEELWNITKFYQYDHTKSAHLLCDFREHAFKKQNFLKFFRTVNYTSENFQSLNDAVYLRFDKFIKNKNIVVIPQENNILNVENFVQFIFNLKIKTKILLFDYNIENNNKVNAYVRNMLKIMDFPNFFSLPYIFLTLRSFPHLSKKGVFFLDIIDSGNGKGNDNCHEESEKEVNEEEKEKKTNKRKDKKLINNSNNVNNNNLNSNGKCFNICDGKFSMQDFHDEKILKFYKTFQIGICLQLNFKNNNSNRNSNKDSIGKRNLLKSSENLKSIKDINTKNKANKNINNTTNKAAEAEKIKSNKANKILEKRKSAKNLIELRTSNDNNQIKNKNKTEKNENKENKNCENSLEMELENENESKYDFNLKYFEINDLNYLDDLLIKKEKLLDFLDCLNFEIFSNKSFILQIPSDFNSKVLIVILHLIIWKVTNLKPMLLKNYIRQNFYCYFQNMSENFSNQNKNSNNNNENSDYLESLTDKAFSEIAEFLIENFDVPTATESDVFFDYNDFAFAEDLNENKNLLKFAKTKRDYESNLSIDKRRLRSLPNIEEENCNYFSLPLIRERKPEKEENKNQSVYLSKKKEGVSLIKVN